MAQTNKKHPIEQYEDVLDNKYFMEAVNRDDLTDPRLIDYLRNHDDLDKNLNKLSAQQRKLEIKILTYAQSKVDKANKRVK